jgi:hypothetical protein
MIAGCYWVKMILPEGSPTAHCSGIPRIDWILNASATALIQVYRLVMMASDGESRIPCRSNWDRENAADQGRMMNKGENVSDPYIGHAFSPSGVNNQTNAAQFSTTVTQNTARNGCFLDL